MHGRQNWDSVTADYRARAVRLSKGKAWLLGLEDRARNSVHPQSATHRKLLDTLEKIVQAMPMEERSKLHAKISRIVPTNADHWRESYDDEFRDLIIEALGWQWLHSRYPDGRVQFNETPDLLVMDSNGAVVAAMECKKFNVSDNERDFMQSEEAEVRNFSVAAPPRLLKKVALTLEKARQQVLSVPDARDKFILISFSFDLNIEMSRIAARESGGEWAYDRVQDYLNQCAARLKNEGIDLVAFERFDVEKRIG